MMPDCHSATGAGGVGGGGAGNMAATAISEFHVASHGQSVGAPTA